MNISRSRIAHLNFWIVLTVLLALAIGCSTPLLPQAPGQQDAPPTPEADTEDVSGEISSDDLPSREPSECPDLDSQLFQITQSSNPIEAAERLGLRIKENKIQVLLILEGEDTNFLKDFEAEIGTQAGEKVQAFVPIDRLCELANADEVLAIRLPAQAAPQ